MLFEHEYIFWHSFRSDPLCFGFLWVFFVALGLIYKRIVKVLSNCYKKYFAKWKLILWAPFSATLHYHNRILANARKQRTKKGPKTDPLCPRRPYWIRLVDLFSRALNCIYKNEKNKFWLFVEYIPVPSKS